MDDTHPKPTNDVAIEGLVDRAAGRAGEAAIVDETGPMTYGELSERSLRVADALLRGGDDLNERRIAFLVSPSALWAVASWGVMRAGGIGVPLLGRLPDAELGYILDDSGADFILTDEANRERIESLASRTETEFGVIENMMTSGAPLPDRELPALSPDRGCLIMYTSGSTGKPKGVVWTQGTLKNQIEILTEAWGWTSDDVSLLILPLHHVHGVVNILTSSLWAGATCRIPEAVDAETIWSELNDGGVTVFMAVPTIYHRLIASWDAASVEEQQRRSDAAHRMRLMISGSAALPVPVLNRWREISGHTLLERYGMTELGMVLSNPLDGDRIPGAVGRPLPTVETRVVDDSGVPIEPPGSGHLQVAGPSVFREYWGRAEQTAEAFDGGWFITGDVVSLDEDGIYRILGRDSVDIIKTGGEKVSALEIEDILRQHDAIDECAVVGVPDPEWGERVAVAVVLRGDGTLTIDELRDWSRPRMAPFKMPTMLDLVDALPRNAMGKVVKPRLVESFEARDQA
jgi:malonyl-CoA/methylmalonyl-CoA synthetase